MPKAESLKCYFGCVLDGPLHRFPTWEYPHTEKFNQWKSILKPTTQEKGNNYIYNSVRICYRHFEDKYTLPSRRLTLNAIPTLNTGVQPIEVDLQPVQEHHEEESLISGLQQNLAAEADIEMQSTSGPSLVPVQLSMSNLTPHSEIVAPGTSKRSVLKRKKSTSPKIILTLRDRIKTLRLKCKTLRKQIVMAKNLSMSKSFTTTIEKLPEAAQVFLTLQLKGKNKPKGRRFTENEKIMALTILKQSPKAYGLLKKMFVLPSKRCLQKILSAFTLRPGINSNIFENLKKVVEKMPAEKKIVNLLFDEISLAPGLVYNATFNEIIGFEDDGMNKTKTIADHALVFMVKSIKSKIKLPLCFVFSKSGIKKNVLKDLILKMIKKINETGLKVVATICDQSPTNVTVIKELLQEGGQNKYFEVDNSKVFPLFDTPHLLKGVRNNLLNKDAKFMQNGKEKWAKWEHLQMLLEIDVGEEETRLVNKLTENHIIKEKIKKMKVKLAAQVFSQRVSSALRFSAKHGILPAECADTADFLLLFDQLFDSFNGHSYQDNSKIYKGCIKKNSPHFQLWADLLPILESIKFKSVIRRNGVEYTTFKSIPSIKNWINNIKTFVEMWEYLSIQHKIVNLVGRNFNQDPLENFFSSIRSNGVRNINPNCYQFINAFKTLIINNYNSPHSAGANCEQDFNKVMQSLSHMHRIKRDDSRSADFACDIDSLLNAMGEMKSNDSLLHAESKKYISGYVIKKSKSKIFHNCNICLNDLRRNSVDFDSFNYEIDYTKRSLFHPSDEFIKLINEIYYMIVVWLRDKPESKFLHHKIKFFIDCACDFSIIRCSKHKADLIDFICNISIKLIVHNWCLGVNRILYGKISKFDKNDHVKKQAFDCYVKKKRK